MSHPIMVEQLVDVQRPRRTLSVEAQDATDQEQPVTDATLIRFDTITENVEAAHTFVADAAHELRTPLTALRLRLENLEPLLAAGTGEELTAAIAEADRLSQLLDSLLARARTQAATVQPEVVDVATAVHERHRLWHAVARKQGVHLTVDVPFDCRARAIPSAVPQTIDNLVANALRVTPAGGTVCVRVETRTPWLELHVVDDGPGLSREHRERAFDRFWRHPTASRAGGSGLGLSIVRRLVEASGGSAELHATTGGGIDAVVRLPMAGGPRTTGRNLGGRHRLAPLPSASRRSGPSMPDADKA